MQTLFDYHHLFDFTSKIFVTIGCSEEDAHLASTVLLSADLRGIDSHGIARLSGYVRLWEAGRVNTKPSVKIIYESLSTATIDADRALGLIAAPRSMDLAIQKAKQCGTGWVSVQNSNHFGIAGYHAMMALAQEMIGIAMTNASALVAPTYSKERLLGTNPIAVAVPAGEENPFIADMATTTAANGKLEILQRKNMDAPLGWIQNQDGSPAINAHALKEGGALLPLGSDYEHGSHKGYALGSIVDIFSAMLSGANFGPWVPPFPAYVPMPENQPGKGIGHFFGAMRIDGFRPAQDFKKDMDQWLRRFRGSTPVEGQTKVMVPGDPERMMEAERRINGIPLLTSVVEDLSLLADKFKIKL
jgi:L-2-hydroxycarboxylate dehydrogenase (NAD+)